MNFSHFLKAKRTKLNFHSVRQLYDSLGGEKYLGISFRQFQNLEAGTSSPTVDVLAKIFEKESTATRHTLIGAFFESHLYGQSSGEALLKYMSKHLTTALEEGHFNWERAEHRQYSESQLDFLNSNSEVMRLHRKLILFEKINRAEVTISPKLLKQMKEHELIDYDTKTIRPSTVRYRLPKYGTANPRMVAKGHDFILKQIELFISKEGSPKQELAYAFQTVDVNIAKAALEQLRLLKEWIQSHVHSGTPSSEKDLVPLVFIGLAKELESHELEG
jgi:hypothetical protein